MKQGLLLLLTWLLLQGCDAGKMEPGKRPVDGPYIDLDTTMAPRATLVPRAQDAEQRWLSRQITSYRLKTREQHYLYHHDPGLVEVKKTTSVVGDIVTDVECEDITPHACSKLEVGPSEGTQIKHLFTQLKDALGIGEQTRLPGMHSRLEVTFDQELGYPQKLAIFNEGQQLSWSIEVLELDVL